MKIIKSTQTLAACTIIILSLTGCTSSRSNSLQTVSIDGSTSMEKVIGYLSEVYMDNNPDIKITYNPTGSGSGIQAVLEGRCDIGLSSRNLTEDERENLNETVISIDAIAVIVNNENSISDLSNTQIAQIYTGEITNFKELGGEDLQIVCIGREAASGTRDGFEYITNTVDKCKYSQELTSTGDIIQTVSLNQNAIGYGSLASISDKVKVVSVDGVLPTEETVLDKTYKIQRDFILVTPKDKELSDSAKDFYNFAISKEADEYIRKAGAIPVEKDS